MDTGTQHTPLTSTAHVRHLANLPRAGRPVPLSTVPGMEVMEHLIPVTQPPENTTLLGENLSTGSPLRGQASIIDGRLFKFEQHFAIVAELKTSAGEMPINPTPKWSIDDWGDMYA